MTAASFDHALTGPASLRRQLWLWIAVSATVWAVVGWLANGNLDGYFDMLENYAWSQSFQWGTHKHPPFFSWTTGLWFSLFPTGDASYRALSYVNVAVGLAGVAYLARRLQLQRFAPVAVLLLLWSFPYTTLAGKFNANAQLLSLWPWTAAFLLASFQEVRWRGALASVLLGVLAAACMLTKYVSGVFLAGFLLPTLLTPQGRQWLRTPRPYLALLAFAATLAPHVAWVAKHGWITLSYATDQGDGRVEWKHIVRFLVSPVLYWLPGWLAVTGVYAWLGQGGGWLGRWRRAMATSWRSQGWGDTLFWLALSTWLGMLLFGLSSVVTLSIPWAIPIGFAFSLLWLRNLDAADPAATARALPALARAFWPALALVVALGFVQMRREAADQDSDYYRPNEAAGQAVVAHWRRTHPDVPLRWVGGDWAQNALVAFYGDPSVRTLPGLPDSPEAKMYDYPDWARQGGLLFCGRGPVGADGKAPAPAAECEDAAAAWLARQGQAVGPVLLKVRKPMDWRFPHPQPYVYAIFEYLPAQAR
ncbi:glycosyltransferase family 39 protein [Comamonas humi]